MLKSLQLVHFRNHEHLVIEFDSRATLLIGKNAAGKTNILEAIYLLATGESFKAGKIEEMVSWDSEVGHVIGKVSGASGVARGTSEVVDELQVTVTRGIVQGRKVQKRLFKVNGAGRHQRDFVGQLPTVLFKPEDMDLLTGSANERRRFLDEILCQVDHEYARSLGSYEKALKRRNKLLDLIREGTTQRTALMFWDQVLIKDGAMITAGRERLLEAINRIPSLSGKLVLHYDRSTISAERLKQYAEQEVAVGYTLVGPHKDDFQLFDTLGNNRNLAIYGSRGEQRMAVLWLKQAQLAFVEQSRGERPLLLLDDIFSELDPIHEKIVAELVGQQQTIVTSADEATSNMFGKISKQITLPIEELIIEQVE